MKLQQFETQRDLAEQRCLGVQRAQQRSRLRHVVGGERLTRTLEADAEIENAQVRFAGDFRGGIEFRRARAAIAAKIRAPRAGEQKRRALLVRNFAVGRDGGQGRISRSGIAGGERDSGFDQIRFDLSARDPSGA